MPEVVIKIANQQYRGKVGGYIYVHKLEAEPGAQVRTELLLLDNEDGSDLWVKPPSGSGKEAHTEVLEHVKADKCIVFKKKRRKGYRVKRGHRQPYTKLHIQSVS